MQNAKKMKGGKNICRRKNKGTIKDKEGNVQTRGEDLHRFT